MSESDHPEKPAPDANRQKPAAAESDAAELSVETVDAAELDFDPDELIENAFGVFDDDAAVAGSSRVASRKGQEPAQAKPDQTALPTMIPDSIPTGTSWPPPALTHPPQLDPLPFQPGSMPPGFGEQEQPTVRRLREFDEKEAATLASRTDSAQHEPPREDTERLGSFPLVDLEFGSDFAAPEEIAIAEDLAQHWERRSTSHAAISVKPTDPAAAAVVPLDEDDGTDGELLEVDDDELRDLAAAESAADAAHGRAPSDPASDDGDLPTIRLQLGRLPQVPPAPATGPSGVGAPIAPSSRAAKTSSALAPSALGPASSRISTSGASSPSSSVVPRPSSLPRPSSRSSTSEAAPTSGSVRSPGSLVPRSSTVPASSAAPKSTAPKSTAPKSTAPKSAASDLVPPVSGATRSEVPSLTETAAQPFVVETISSPPESLTPSDAAPRSVPPPIPPEVELGPAPEYWPDVSSGFDDAARSSASDVLLEQGQLESWSKRAEWLEREAQVLRDPHAQARAQLAVSEIWALVGDTQRARACADTAHKLWGSLALATRQTRWLDAREGRWGEVAAALEIEDRAAPTADARVHAANLHAELLTRVLGDRAQAHRKIEIAARAKPDDVRAHVVRLVEALSQSAAAPRGVMLKDDLSPLLQSALARLGAMRGAALGEIGHEPGQDAGMLLFEQARRAVEQGDGALAASALERLAGELQAGENVGAWLGASLLALSSSSRDQAIEKLGAIQARQPSSAVRRALAVRAIEQSSLEAARLAIKSADDTFSAADKTALAALTGSLDAALIDQLPKTDELLPLRVALAAVSGAEAQHTALSLQQPDAGERHAAEFSGSELGRALVNRGEGRSVAIEHALNVFETLPDAEPLARLLRIECLRSRAAQAEVAKLIGSWPHPEAEPKDAERDRHLGAAFLSEQCGDTATSQVEYEAAFTADSSQEAAARALLEHDPERQELLGNVAQACADDTQSALLSLEIASSAALSSMELDVLLARAAHNPIASTLAQQLGEWHSRRGRDSERLLGWLQARRQEADDPTERAIMLLREARVLTSTEPRLAVSLLEESSQVKPQDTTLKRIHEHFNPSVPSQARAEWREALATKASPTTAQWLYLEAACEYDKAGDDASVARVCRAALALGACGLASAMLERATAQTEDVAELAEQLLSQARQTDDAERQRQLYERLSAIDLGRGDRASARLWQSAILERNPEYLPALRHVEHAYIGTGRVNELEQSATVLAKLLDKDEANAHAWLAARIQARNSGVCTRELTDWVIQRVDPPTWALRARLEHARTDEDKKEVLKLYELLLAGAQTPADEATLALRAAEAATSLGQVDTTERLLGIALQALPTHPVALDRRTDLLIEQKRHREAAELLEVAAHESLVDAHGAEAWFRAAELWLTARHDQADPLSVDRADEVLDLNRGKRALEQAVARNPGHVEAFHQLQELYFETGEQGRLAELLEARLAQTTDPSERVPLEIARAKALADMGDREGALVCLRAALDTSPEHVEALDLFADISMQEEHWEDAEQAWIRLTRHLTDPAAQAESYRRLAKLYVSHLKNAPRAELACQEVLKRFSADVDASETLVTAYSQLGEAEKAVQVQTELFRSATTEEGRRDRVLELAALFENVARDPARTKQTFEKAHKVWPHDGKVLRRAADYFARSGDLPMRRVLLDRAASDARRALGTGRFGAAYFELLASVADLRGDTDSAQVTRATVAAVLGGSEPAPRGAGKLAGDPNLDDLLAPELISPALRALLLKSGRYLDAAYPLELSQYVIEPLAARAPALARHARELAEAFGLHALETGVADGLGVTCLAVRSDPPSIVCGAGLLDVPDRKIQEFLLIRTLKILQARVAVLMHTPAAELSALVTGWFEALAPSYRQESADRARVEEHVRRISQRLPHDSDAETTTLALEVSAALGTRATQLAPSIHRWASRVALLATGDPGSAFQALALASGLNDGLPVDPAERLKWVLRNPDARDLAVFAVGSRYAEARSKLGLRSVEAPPAPRRSPAVPDERPEAPSTRKPEPVPDENPLDPESLASTPIPSSR